jgi:glycosyltransferase involved in cell wall biosynthesis
MACWITQFIHRRPYVVSVHGSDIYMGGKIPPVRWLTRLALNRAGIVTSNSRALAKATMDLGVNVSKMVIVNVGIDVSRFKPKEGPRQDYILYVGSFIRRKGVEFLIQAFPEIHAHHPQTRLVLVGDGPLKSEYSSTINRLGIQNSVDFLGWQSPDQVSEWMRNARLLILPSINEAYGVVLLEALASGTPCIASEVDGIVEIIDPEVGILVPPGDGQAISRAVNRLLSDEELYARLSQAGRERAVNQFDWKLKARQTFEYYQQVLAGKQRTARD